MAKNKFKRHYLEKIFLSYQFFDESKENKELNYFEEAMSEIAKTYDVNINTVYSVLSLVGIEENLKPLINLATLDIVEEIEEKIKEINCPYHKFLEDFNSKQIENKKMIIKIYYKKNFNKEIVVPFSSSYSKKKFINFSSLDFKTKKDISNILYSGNVPLEEEKED